MLTTAAILHPTEGVGGLLASAHSLSGAVADWWRGVDLGGSQCGAPEVIGPCPTSPGEPPERPPTPSRWAPSIIRQSVECSTLSGDMGDYAATALSLTREWAVARTLQFGGDNNPSLDGSATPLGTVSTLRDAIAELEADTADELTGRRAYLHVPQGLSIYLPRTVRRDDAGRWRTPAGNVVIVSPGYSGSTVYATGEVWASVGQRSAVDIVRRDVNVAEAWVDEIGLAVFHPCYVTSVTIEDESNGG